MSMKKILLFCFCLMCVENVLSTPNFKTTHIGLKGPVKKMVVESNISGHSFTWEYCFDTTGRLTKQFYYVKRKLSSGYMYQYIDNNMRIDSEYNSKGLIEGVYRRVQLDSLGNEICSKRYKNGEIYYADSTVYNTEGKEIEHYRMTDGKLTLRYTCKYDSLGRISAKLYADDDSTKKIYEYSRDGSYMLFLYRGSEVEWYKKHVFNSDGLLVVIRGATEYTTFSDFDKYNNWTSCQSVNNWKFGKSEGIYKRTIEYYE